MDSAQLRGKLQSDLWKTGPVAGWLGVKIICGIMVCAHWLKRLLETSILVWKQKQDHHRASKDFHHPRGTLPKLLLPGFVSQSGKHCCSSWVGAASTPRSEQKPQWSLLWYFPCPIKGVWTDLFASHPRLRTRGLGHKEGLVHKGWGAWLLLGEPRTRQQLSCSCGTSLNREHTLQTVVLSELVFKNPEMIRSCLVSLSPSAGRQEECLKKLKC